MKVRRLSRASPGKRIALYPGAFRPPHAAHMHAIQYLAHHPDIDEVVIIISGRFRHIPGTDLALGPEVAEAVWRIYLKGLTNVRVVVAEQTAVSYALDYFEQTLPGQILFFCIGETDFRSGDSRFHQIHQRASAAGVSASIIRVPTSGLRIRSTALRASLVDAEKGGQAFMSCLPSNLSSAERKQVWEICQNSWKTVVDITRDRIQKVLSDTAPMELSTELLPGNNRLDPIFFTQTNQGEHLIIKYAGSSLAVVNNGSAVRCKSRDRVGAERLALKWLNKQLRSDIQFPVIRFWIKKEKMLGMNQLGHAGHSLAHRLSEGRFDKWVLERVSVFLEINYRVGAPDEPFWGDQDSDQFQWQQMLEQHLMSARNQYLGSGFDAYLEQLQSMSLAAARHQLVHLDLQPKHILLTDRDIAIVDWESSSTYGDPAYDLGRLLGYFLFYAIQSQQAAAIARLIEKIVLKFQSVVIIEDHDHSFIPRIHGFIGSTLLSLGHVLKENESKQLTEFVKRIVSDYFD